jgi:hypothetical protein
MMTTELTCKQSETNRRKRLDARNRVMVARYYYWTERRRRRFDDVLRILSEDEFFVEERTVSNILTSYSAFLDECYGSPDALSRLRREYPSWSWG